MIFCDFADFWCAFLRHKKKAPTMCVCYSCFLWLLHHAGTRWSVCDFFNNQEYYEIKIQHARKKQALKIDDFSCFFLFLKLDIFVCRYQCAMKLLSVVAHIIDIISEKYFKNILFLEVWRTREVPSGPLFVPIYKKLDFWKQILEVTYLRQNQTHDKNFTFLKKY